MRKRNNAIYVYLSDNEKKHLDKQIENSGINISTFIRKLIMSEVIRPRPPDDYYRLLREINAIGVNINQIAHIANSMHSISNDRIEYAVQLVDKIMEKVREFE